MDATYTLKEVVAPEGYAKIKDIVFKAEKIEGNLALNIVEGKVKETIIEDSTIKIVLEDSPSLKIMIIIWQFMILSLLLWP